MSVENRHTNFFVAGIDEAGRGPLAGPVTAAAVVFPPGYQNSLIADSKKLTESRREKLYPEIVSSSIAYAIVSVGPRRIDKLNIREATKLAMRLAARRVSEQLQTKQVYFLIDGNMSMGSEFKDEPIVKGDQKILAISAASILAKVTRDRLMTSMEQFFPGYDLAKHKGYPTKHHRAQIAQLKPATIHRKTFAGVKEFLL